MQIHFLSVCILLLLLSLFSEIKQKQDKNRVILLSPCQLHSSDSSSRTVSCFLWKETVDPQCLSPSSCLLCPAHLQLLRDKRHANCTLFSTNQGCSPTSTSGLQPHDLDEQCTNFTAMHELLTFSARLRLAGSMGCLCISIPRPY